LAPTGTKDPFGLRRAAIGVVQPLIEHDLGFDLRAALQAAASLEPIPAGEEVVAQVLEFVAGRLRAVLLDMGCKYDAVDAVLAAQSNDPAGAARTVKQLSVWVKRKDWKSILPAYARCVRIIRSAEKADHGPWAVDDGLLIEEAERALIDALRKAVHGRPSTVDELLNIVVELVPAIDLFFDKVLVMDDDPKLRLNRLALVGEVAGLADGIADLSKLEGF
jgi:glycyl-tRNA synthetase